MRYAWTVILLLVVVAGCGQTGPLVLPDAPADEEESEQPNDR